MKSLFGSCWNVLTVTFAFLAFCHGFSSENPTTATSTRTSSSEKALVQPVGGILILDHLNINHEKGRHDWLKAFYFDFLKLAVDPRKEDNLIAGKKTVWANAGANQFHLPEGKPHAQVLNGVVTFVYSDLKPLLARVDQVQSKLKGSLFTVVPDSGEKEHQILYVTDPWGTNFRLVRGSEEERDARGSQPGDTSECLAMRDLTIYTPTSSPMEGIARFYEQILEAPILQVDDMRCVVSVGPRQTLTFEKHPKQLAEVSHTELRDDKQEPPEGYSMFLSNHGPHVSMYVTDLPSCYKRADELGLTYVNPRFKRRAYNLDQATDDCTFRCLDIVDPARTNDGVILQLEHEIRSVVQRDGSKYKSCPFDQVPLNCYP